MKKRILVKVGTNVLGRDNGRLDYNRISDLVDQIVLLQDTYQVLFVSSGAQRAGREFCSFDTNGDPLIKRQMLSSIGQGRLFQVYSDFFREHSVITAQALLTSESFKDRTSFQNMKGTLEGLLNHQIQPIINENDVVSYRESSFGDNDQLAALVASMMDVELLVLLSDIVGFYTADPKKDTTAELIRKVDKVTPELQTLCEDSLSEGGTGGMLSKLKAAEFASQHGIPTIVCCGKEKNCLINAVDGKTTGTYFSATKDKKKRSLKESWMSTGADIKGVITIDKGAAKALNSNKSLLAVGVTKMTGKFKKRDVVLIQNSDHSRIGTGLVNMDHIELREIVKSQQKPKGVIVIHKNHLFTL